MIKNAIKSQCKTPHPQPLSPKRGEGSKLKDVGNDKANAKGVIHEIVLYAIPHHHSGQQCD